MAEEKKSFGDFLVKLGVLTADQLRTASQEQKQRGERLEQTIARLDYAKEELILQCLADYFNLPYVDLDTYLIDENIVKTIPEDLARRHTLIPLFKIGDTLTVAMPDPLNLLALDEVKNKVKNDVEIAIGTEKKIKRAIEQHYGAAAMVFESTIQQMAKGSVGGLSQESTDYRKTHDLVMKDVRPGAMEDASAARVLDLVMIQAIRDRASDIHFEPDEKNFRVRLRIDGFLYESLTLPKPIQPAITSRIKILAEMDIAETRLPQDGNFNVRMEQRGFEIRVSTFPTIYGENVVLRILDQTSPLFNLDDLGFSGEMLNQFKQLVRKTSGIILVTGPTGSGKTTTLYGILNMINSKDKNIITVEDPVEYRLALIRQTQVNPKAGITFATGLRSILRQDPDIIMIGEVRDLETSEIAMQAALTGHLVLSTLHTNDAPEAISRLMDIGVEPYLISSSIIGVLAQRLVRTICPDCKVSYQIDTKGMSDLGDHVSKSKGPLTLYRGKGCKNCKESGFRGRTGIFELLLVNEEIKKLISERASVQVIREVAKKTAGMVPLREDGLEKVLKGITTFKEVDRVAY
ncbi:MAG TPA: ATPase, T2SS/T4P/T4SS family [Thermodesulfobacteriota bacterium]|jgi:type IV pilus assembly protein PilB|nr:ATPase, T2SS/T4P/T4SS family [Thermodesulfobacteriota bacterium]